MESITLACWVYSDDINNVFHVTVPRMEIVWHLRETIKDEHYRNRYLQVASTELTLYTLPRPDREHFKSELEQWNPHGKTKLYWLTNLSVLFPEPGDQPWIIIIVSPLSPAIVADITINCWVLGQEIQQVFPVKISPKKTLDDLRQAIKEKQSVALCETLTSTLVLYKVSVSCNERALRDWNRFSVLLRQSRTLGQVFPSPHREKDVHIVVDASLQFPKHPSWSSLPLIPSNNIQIQRRFFLEKNPSIPPSSGGEEKSFSMRQAQPDQTILCNRPRTAVSTIPATLHHPIFGEFLDDCENYKITPDDNSLVQKLRAAMLETYPDKRKRTWAILDVLNESGLWFLLTATVDGYWTDGDMVDNGRSYIIAQVDQNGGADPFNEAVLYYLESTRYHAEELWHSPLPCITIFFLGPYIAFSGAVWNLRPVVQTLSDVLPMHCHPTNTETLAKIARHLGAFKNAAHKLSAYYRNIETDFGSSRTEHAHLFPYRTSFTCLEDNSRQTFEYLCQPFHDKRLFFGELSDQRPVSIKFSRHYSKDAHLACASLGYAPKLLGFETLPGGWFMAVMDTLPPHEYAELRRCTPSPLLIRNLQDALTELHQRGYVHGDLGDTNIMVSQSDRTKFMLVDFDWAGEIGRACYPWELMRDSDDWRPEGAVCGALILKEHDMEMLKHIAT